MSTNFGNLLILTLNRRGHTHASVAAHCGVCLSTVTRWNNNESVPAPAQVARMLSLLGGGARW